MKPFESLGIFVNPDDPDEEITGHIAYEPGDGIRVRLNGTFGDPFSSALEVGGRETIQGVLFKSPYGRFVTLLDCFPTKLHLGVPKLSSQEVFANRALLSDSPLDDPNRHFKHAHLELTHLQAWSGTTGIDQRIERNGDSIKQIQFTCRYPDPIVCRLDFGVITLNPSYNIQRDAVNGIHVSPNKSFELELEEGRTLGDIFQKIVRPLQNLLTFLIDQPSGVQALILSHPSWRIPEIDVEARAAFLFKPLRVIEAPNRLVLPNEMLLEPHSILDLPVLLRNWFQFVDRHEKFTTSFFNSLDREYPYVDSRFLHLVWLIGLFHLSQLPIEQSQALSAKLAKCFGESNLVEHATGAAEAALTRIAAWACLERAAKESPKQFSAIVGGDTTGFIQHLKKTTADTELRTSINDKTTSSELYWTAEKLDGLIRFLMLVELGFDDDTAGNLIQRNRRFAFASQR